MRWIDKNTFNISFWIKTGGTVAGAGLLSALLTLMIYGEFAFWPFVLGAGVLIALISAFRFLHFLISFTKDELHSLLTTLLSGALVSSVASLMLYSVFASGFNLTDMDWVTIFSTFFTKGLYWILFGGCLVGFFLLYYFFIAKEELRWAFFRKGIRGKGELSQIEGNLENSRWLTDKERDQIFKS